ncbi:hypothetical protein BDZ94DRAFT_358376 [Collybia nuda]|uniref:Uncharacterized protein n=1 Tax=Collybia nuda TaxID=64659 RepID=A0A9P5YFR5_9AGAR|nr:hypothetical protein BDZ94DRAFT_358376 [Collybia nuda]
MIKTLVTGRRKQSFSKNSIIILLYIAEIVGIRHLMKPHDDLVMQDLGYFKSSSHPCISLGTL